MRHVSRTHRVAQDWLFDRIYLDLKIQIKYVDTKKQLADMLTEGNFTRDEWNHLLRLFNISHFSLNYCSQNFILTRSDGEKDSRTERRREDCGKVKKMLIMASLVSANSSAVQSPIASTSPVILKAPCQNDWTGTGGLGAREFNQDAASTSQAWQKDAVLDESTRRLAATEEDQEHLNFPEDSKSTRRLVGSGNADTQGKDNIWPHNLQISTDCEPHMEMVFERHNGKLSI